MNKRQRKKFLFKGSYKKHSKLLNNISKKMRLHYNIKYNGSNTYFNKYNIGFFDFVRSVRCRIKNK